MGNRLFGGTRRDAAHNRHPRSTTPSVETADMPYIPEQVFDQAQTVPHDAAFATLYRGSRKSRCIVVGVVQGHKYAMAVLDLVSEGDVIGRQQQVPIFDALEDPALEARLVQCPASMYAIREPKS
jgi:hypothetical protein